jgi:hypothetical protein
VTLRDEPGEVIVGDTTRDGVVPPGPASALARGGTYDFTDFFKCEKEEAPRCLTGGQSFRIQGVPQAVGPRSTATTEQLCGSTLSRARRGIESLIFVRGAPSAAPYLSISGGYDWLAREERAGGAASALDRGALDLEALDAPVLDALGAPSEHPVRPPLSTFILSSSSRSLSSGRALHGASPTLLPPRFMDGEGRSPRGEDSGPGDGRPNPNRRVRNGERARVRPRLAPLEQQTSFFRTGDKKQPA